jgi:hypothetical protein
MSSEIVIGRRRYVIGLDRIPVPACDRRVAHLYRGTFANPGMPMCPRGWNRDKGRSYSIWRGHTGKGICPECERRAKAGLSPVPPRAKLSPGAGARETEGGEQ